MAVQTEYHINPPEPENREIWMAFVTSPLDRDEADRIRTKAGHSFSLSWHEAEDKARDAARKMRDELRAVAPNVCWTGCYVSPFMSPLRKGVKLATDHAVRTVPD